MQNDRTNGGRYVDTSLDYVTIEPMTAPIVERMVRAVLTGTDDSGNPNLLFQTVETDLLLAIEAGVLDVGFLVRQELNARRVTTGRAYHE